MPAQPVLDLKCLSRGYCPRRLFPHHIDVVRMDVLCPAVAERILEWGTGEIDPPLVEVCRLVIRIGHPDHDGSNVSNEAELRVALLLLPAELF